MIEAPGFLEEPRVHTSAFQQGVFDTIVESTVKAAIAMPALYLDPPPDLPARALILGKA